MKPLIVCYSLTGNTMKICESLASSIGADLVRLYEVPDRSIFSAYTFGCLKAIKKKGSNILPIEADISEYDTIIVAGPVWANNPAPALYSFIRQYDLSGKVAYGVLSCLSDKLDAAKALRDELGNAETDCKSIITIKTDKTKLLEIKKDLMHFNIDENGKLTLEKIDK